MINRTVSVPASVLALLAHGAPAYAIICNDIDTTIQAHRDRQAELTEAQTTILATADAEGRELTVEEGQQLDELSAEFDRLDNEINRRARAQTQFEAITASAGRQADPDPTPDEPIAAATPSVRNAAPSARVPAAPRISANGNYGFRNFGEFALAVRNANPTFGGQPDQRLVKNASLSTYGNEGSGADGGFAVPPDFRSEIMTKVFGEDSLVGRTDRQVTTSNQISVPIDMTTPWDSSGGIQAYWTGEGSAITQSKPSLQNVTVRAHKLAALVPITEEMSEDAPFIDGYLRRKVPEKLDFVISNALVRGDGVAKPLGFLNGPCLSTVAAESGQTADTIVAANVLKMFAAMPISSRSTAVWLIHPDAEPQLPLMTIGQMPVYVPAGGLSGSKYGTLLGRPVIPHQVCETIGDVGDIMFVDFNQYLTLTKTGGGRDANGMRAETSMHLWFDQDAIAYKTTIRIGGQPWWSTTTAMRDGSFTQSPFVALAAR